MNVLKNILKFVFKKTGFVMVNGQYYKSLIHKNDVYAYAGLLLIRNFLSNKKKTLILDIGANQGQTAKKLIDLFPFSDIHCFEPVKDTFAILQENVKGIKNVHLHNCAFGLQQSEKIIYHQSNSEWNSLSSSINVKPFANEKSEIIKVDTIDNFVYLNNITKIHLLKSDTEGYELEVLSGAAKSLADQIIDLIYVEVGFSKTDSQHNFWSEVTGFLNGYNYVFLGIFEVSFSKEKRMEYGNAIFAGQSFLDTNSMD